MNYLLSLLLTAILCATTSAQTIKTLGFNATNGQVVANTGTNVLTFTNTVRFDDGSGDFTSITGPQINTADPNTYIGWGAGVWSFGGKIEFAGTNATANAATTRTNLGLPLATLTNDSNAKLMRALAGSTNTNHPFSGTITIRDFNDDAHDIVVSNGIITSYTAP